MNTAVNIYEEKGQTVHTSEVIGKQELKELSSSAMLGLPGNVLV